MKDELVKALALDGHVRIYIARTTDMVQEARDRFDMGPIATDALGRTLSVASIMGGMLKSDKEMLTISINGHGPIGSITVDAYSNGNVRGFVSDPHVDAPSVAQAVGTDGTLTVIKDLNMVENFTGTVELQSGQIGEDFTYYFTLSEQTPSAVSVGVSMDANGKVEAAGALVLQMMPDATDTDIRIVEHVVEGLKPMSTIIKEYGDTDMSQLARDLFEDAQVLETTDIHFSCPCSKERTKGILMTLSKDEIQQMIDDDAGCEVTCNFCNEHYQFTKDELEAILEEMNA
ncbi:Hsp33 family molecular chaperone HslO [uncultured Dubosiella sp.]|uniref:Hsp33 family molecular chaperone HslO n=1 Tax=uncultured Dubosiella sp. TaxID=1937011 RepID=UPI0025B443BA|nr:Hsp33 family molecular chaperone HslO [uncultured Dubosiella sp.]